MASSRRRPSLMGGAIRPGGDPNERCTRRTVTIIDEQDDTVNDIEMKDLVKVGDCATKLNCEYSRRTIESHGCRLENMSIVHRLLEMSLNKQQQPIQKGSSSTLWADIRQWFSENQTNEDRHAAANLKGTSSRFPLHLLCKHSDAPLDVVKNLIKSGPEVASYADDYGWLPLHHACAQGVREEVLKVLVDNYPLGVSAKDNQFRTPLHFAFFKGESDNVTTTSIEEEEIMLSKTVEILTTCSSTVAKIADKKGRIPLHYAAAYGSSTAALKQLVRAYPESVNVMEDLGRTPLHYVMANAHGEKSPSTLQFLLEYPFNSTLNATDLEGNLPLHLLSERATKYNPLDDSPSRHNVEKCLNIFVNAKTRPDPVPEFFTALQSLPRWLRDSVVTTAFVRDILFRHVSRRFPTMIRIMDNYSYAMIIFCFQYASRSHIKFRYEGTELLPHTTGTIVVCYLGSSYLLVREILDVITSNRTSKSWFFDWNWFNILVIGLIYYYCGEMIRREEELDLENFRTGAVVTLGSLWIAIINYMRKSSLDFAVFFEAMQCVTRHLSVFMIALTGFLLFFAQMFVVAFRQRPVCSDICIAEGEFPHCTFQASLMQVYTMMVGEIGDINRYQGHLLGQLLYLAFASLVVILLSNVLIAIITESHSVIKNERAEILFWSNRLYFVSEMVAIASLRRRLVDRLSRLCCHFQTHQYTEGRIDEDQAPRIGSDHIGYGQHYDHPHRMEEEGQGLFREIWNELMIFVREDSLEDPTLSEFLLSLFLRCLVCVVLIPLWLVVGAISAGWLWPPQVREWLQGSHRLSSQSRIVPGNQMGSEIHRLTQDVAEMRVNIQLDLARVRNDFENINADVEEFKKFCKADLAEIKEVMSSILETYEFKHKQKDLQ